MELGPAREVGFPRGFEFMSEDNYHKLNRKQVAQLGGFAAARAAGAAGMKARGSKGGSTTVERHGREHFIRAAHKRWGRLQGAQDESAA
jgi:hypothetical protein